MWKWGMVQRLRVSWLRSSGELVILTSDPFNWTTAHFYTIFKSRDYKEDGISHVAQSGFKSLFESIDKDFF